MTTPLSSVAPSANGAGQPPADPAVAVFLTSPAGIISGWSPGAAGVTGYTAAETIGQDLSIFFPPESRAAGHPYTELAFAARRGRAEYEGAIVHKSGDRVWADAAIIALRDATGMVSGFACTVRDMSRRRAEEAERAATAEHISALSVANPDEISGGLDLATLLPRIVTRARELTAADGVVLELRDGVGDQARAHIGDPHFDIELGSVLMPLESRTRSGDTRVLRYDERNEPPEILGDVCDRMGIGSMLAIPIVHERVTLGWLSAMSASTHAFDEHHAVTVELMASLLSGPVAQAQASESKRALIAERARALAAHRESEARFRAAMDSSLDAVFIVSAERSAEGLITDFQLLDANRCAQDLCGLRRGSFEGKRLSMLQPVRRRIGTIDLIAGVVTSNAPSEHEKQIHSSAGTRWFQEQLVPFGDGAMITLRDVTARMEADNAVHRAREAAEAANRAKTEFVARMSHELRTPLNSVIGFSNILLRNKREVFVEEELGYIDRIQSAGKHLLALINDVLDIAKVEAGRMSLDISQVDLVALCRQVIAQLEPAAGAAGLNLVLDTPVETLVVQADDGKLRQVLLNLIGNAIKFTPSGSVSVRLLANAEQRAEAVEITDTGIGIPEDRVSAIFEAFEQAESSTSRRYGGTGLGLSISRALCDAMGFVLTAKSAMGQGSTFRIGLSPQQRSARAALST